jgi:hypothetical protein
MLTRPVLGQLRKVSGGQLNVVDEIVDNVAASQYLVAYRSQLQVVSDQLHTLQINTEVTTGDE